MSVSNELSVTCITTVLRTCFPHSFCVAPGRWATYVHYELAEMGSAVFEKLARKPKALVGYDGDGGRLRD